jgi:hypothetical protein
MTIGLENIKTVGTLQGLTIDLVLTTRTGNLDILTAVKRTVIPKPHDLGFCFFPLRGSAPALTDLLCSGLMVALQTDTASPAAKMFLLALISRSW